MHRISRRKFGKSVLSGIAASATLAGPASSNSRASVKRKPNILFISSDQHCGFMLLGGPGKAAPVRTPNLERLARMGVHFRNAYTVDPVCTPGRAAMMTGRFASDVGSYGNSTPFDGHVPTWGGYLRRAGYYTWASGKLDLSPKADEDFHQVDTSNGHYVHPDITSLFRRPMCYRVNERPQVDGKVEDRSRHDRNVLKNGLEFLRTTARSVGKPWAAYLGFIMPHPPFHAPQEYWDMYPPDQVQLPNIPEGYLEKMAMDFRILRQFKMIATPISEERIRRARTCYYGMITQIDAIIGQVLDELEKSGELENTVIVYTSDHGEMHGMHGLWFKNNLFEAAARVPMFMAGAGLPRGLEINDPVSHVDLIATLLDLAGMSRPSGLRGHTLLPLIQGDRAAHPPFVYAESNSEGNCTGSFMIRKGDWKYIYFAWYGNNLLFNLKEDPGEINNLADDPAYAARVKELHGLLTSLVDPEAINEAAFKKQHEVLMGMVHSKTPEQFFHTLKGRLGRGQATALTRKYYPNWRPPAAAAVGRA